MKISKINFLIIFDIIFIVFLMGGYFLFAFDHLREQGIYCDVGLLGNKAMGIYKNLRFEDSTFITLRGRSFPLVLLDYHGPVEIYLFLPALYIFGNMAFALHIVPVVFGGLTLPLFYVLVLLLYRSRILSAVLSLLLAFSPTFIAANRVGFYTGSILMFFGVSSVLCFLLWVRKKRFSWLAGACLLLGLGIGSRCFFWWFSAALLIFSIIFYRKPLQELRNLCLRKKLISFFMLSIGFLPLILFNILSRFQTIQFFAKHTIVSADGISNLNYLQNLKERVSESLNILKGTAYSGGNENTVNVYMLAVSVIIFILSFIYAQVFKKQRIRGSYLFPLVIFLLVLIQSPLTCSGLSALHIYYMMPFALMIIASAVMVSKNRIMQIFFLVLFMISGALSLCSNFYSLQYRKAHLSIHGGLWNTAGDVIKWLDNNNVKRIGLGDTGIMDQLMYLSGYQLDVEEIFYGDYLSKFISREAKENMLRQRLRSEKEGYYLFRANPWVPYFERFQTIAKEENKQITLVKEFVPPDSGREQVYLLYKVANIRK